MSTKDKQWKLSEKRTVFNAEKIACPLCRVYWETRHDFQLLRANMRAIRSQRRRKDKQTGKTSRGVIPQTVWKSLTKATRALQDAAAEMLETHPRCSTCGILLGLGHDEDYWRTQAGALVCYECAEPPGAAPVCYECEELLDGAPAASQPRRTPPCSRVTPCRIEGGTPSQLAKRAAVCYTPSWRCGDGGNVSGGVCEEGGSGGSGGGGGGSAAAAGGAEAWADDLYGMQPPSSLRD